MNELARRGDFEAEADINYFELVQEELERRKREENLKEQRRIYLQRLETAYQQVLQIVRREDIDSELKAKVVMKFAKDFPNNPHLLEPEIGLYLPDFTIVTSVYSYNDDMGVYVNGLYTQFRTPALIPIKVRAIVHLDDGIEKGAWALKGTEQFIKFERESIEAGSALYIDTGGGRKMIGYRFKEDITQQEFGSIIKSSKDLRVVCAKDCWRISFIFSLADCYELEALDLSRTHVADIRALANLKNLRYLDLRDTHISDVSVLARLKEMRWLSLWNTNVQDITPLACLTKLEGVNLIRTEVADLSPLLNLSNLRVMYLDEGKIQVT